MSLSEADRMLMLSAWYRLCHIRIVLSLTSYRRVREHIQRSLEQQGKQQLRSVSPRKIASSVSVVSRMVPSATCLVQALVADWMLKEAGFSPSLYIGVKKESSDCFEAHAWVELGDECVIGGAAAEGFEEIYRD